MEVDLPEDPIALRAFRDATLFRLVHRAHRAEVAETVARVSRRGHGTITYADAELLSNLDAEGTTISALARRSGVSRQAASQQLVAIERNGYVTRRPNPVDGRAILVRLTPRGRALLRDALESVAEVEAEYAALVGEAKFAALKRTLATLVGHIDSGGVLGRE